MTTDKLPDVVWIIPENGSLWAYREEQGYISERAYVRKETLDAMTAERDRTEQFCAVCVATGGKQVARIAELKAELAKATARLDFVLPIIGGDDNDDADRRTIAIGRALMQGLSGQAAIDAAMAAQPEPTK